MKKAGPLSLGLAALLMAGLSRKFFSARFFGRAKSSKREF
jgi:hypothetical protein